MEAIRIWLDRKPSRTCKEIASRLVELDVQVSAKTVRRELNKAEITYRHRTSKPKLTVEQMKACIAFCNNNKDNFPWDFVVFSDESYSQLQRNALKVWSPRTSDREIRMKNWSPAFMVWGAISSFANLAIMIGTGGIKKESYRGESLKSAVCRRDRCTDE